jgi:trehalose/maltose transport system substrate-binding protein
VWAGSSDGRPNDTSPAGERIRRAAVAGLLLACAAALTGCRARPGTAAPRDVALGYHTLGVPGEAERGITRDFTERTGVHVFFMPGLESASDHAAQTVAALERRDGSPDVHLIDVTAPGVVAEHLLDLRAALGDDVQQLFPTLVHNDTVAGRLVAIPLYTDVSVFYYRTDLLAKYGYAGPPDTWDELDAMAARIQAGERAAGNAGFWGFVWQGRAYEGLTCNALEWQASHGGGRIIEDDGRVSVNNPRAARAFERAAKWVGTISPPTVTAYMEEDARNVFQSGNAAFMRNWPYVYPSAQAPGSPVRSRFDVGPLPRSGGPAAHVLGGWQVAVSRYTAHPAEAVQFALYLTSLAAQKRRMVESAHLASRVALYDDPQVLAANPYCRRLKPVFLGGTIARPSTVTGRLYPQVSDAYYTAVHSILTRQSRPAEALERLEARLVAITGFPVGPPSP